MRAPFVSLIFFLVLGTSAASTQVEYFPERVFCETHESGLCERWYVKHLQAMAEPSLWEQSKNDSKESYRFLWLRTFDHPVAIRLTLAKDGSAQLTFKILSGAGGYEPGHLIRNRSSHVSKEAVDHFVGLLNEADFWNSPAEESKDGIVLDGAQWIIEGAKNGQYHVVDRWSPDKGPFRHAALFLMTTLAGFDPPYSQMY